jgi:hypothetical protein
MRSRLNQCDASEKGEIRWPKEGADLEQGRQWSEGIWTVIATCSQQGKSVYDFLRAVVASWFAGTTAPSLLAPTA